MNSIINLPWYKITSTQQYKSLVWSDKMSKNNYKQKTWQYQLKSTTQRPGQTSKRKTRVRVPFPVKFKWKTPRNMPIQIKNKNKSKANTVLTQDWQKGCCTNFLVQQPFCMLPVTNISVLPVSCKSHNVLLHPFPQRQTFLRHIREYIRKLWISDFSLEELLVRSGRFFRLQNKRILALLFKHRLYLYKCQ